MGRKKHKIKKTHDEILDDLVERLCKKEYNSYIGREENYTYNMVDGEVDLYELRMVKDKKYLLIFEVKSSDLKKNYNKAVKQLNKGYDFLNRKYIPDRTYCFYVAQDTVKRVYINGKNNM